MSNFFEEKNEMTGIQMIKDYSEIMFHKKSAKTQKESFDTIRKNKAVLENALVIVFDWKQKIGIGMSERQVNLDYRKQSLRACCGFEVYYLELGEIKKMFFAVISGIVEQTAEIFIYNFRFIRNHPLFKIIDKKKYYIYSDQATNFRCNKLANYLFVELLENGIEVDWNFFAERHGHSLVDGQFSRIGNLIKRERNILKSSQDIVDCINRKQKMVNDIRQKYGKCSTNIVAVVYLGQIEHEPEIPNIFKIVDIESFLNFKRNKLSKNLELVTTIFSNLIDEYPLIIIKKNFKEEKKVLKINSDKIQETEIFGLSSLIKTRIAISQMIRNHPKGDKSILKLLDFSINSKPNKIIRDKEDILIDDIVGCTSKCKNCKSTPAIRVKDLKEHENRIITNKSKCDTELKIHHHNKTLTNGILRNASQSRLELISHYKKRHVSHYNKTAL